MSHQGTQMQFYIKYSTWKLLKRIKENKDHSYRSLVISFKYSYIITVILFAKVSGKQYIANVELAFRRMKSLSHRLQADKMLSQFLSITLLKAVRRILISHFIANRWLYTVLCLVVKFLTHGYVNFLWRHYFLL